MYKNHLFVQIIVLLFDYIFRRITNIILMNQLVSIKPLPDIRCTAGNCSITIFQRIKILFFRMMPTTGCPSHRKPDLFYIFRVFIRILYNLPQRNKFNNFTAQLIKMIDFCGTQPKPIGIEFKFFLKTEPELEPRHWGCTPEHPLPLIALKCLLDNLSYVELNSNS